MKPRTLLTGLWRDRNRDRGVTLVEMMVVVVILGILATVSTLIITTIFNANIQGGQMLQQQSTIQTASNFFETRLASADVGSVGQKTGSGSAINPTSIAGDQVLFTRDGTCYRLIYLPQAEDLVAATQPVDSSTGACKTGASGISPTRGPTETAPADPVLDAIDVTTGGLKASSSLPDDAHLFTLASDVQSLGSSGAPPFSYCDASCTTTLPVDATAKASSSTGWYSTPANLNSVSSVQVNLEVLGTQSNAGVKVGPRLYSQVYYLGAGDDSGGTLASDPSGFSGFHVRLATTGPLPSNTDSSGTLTATSPGSLGSIDGTVVNIGDRVLVTGEANAAKNGVYDVVDTGSNATAPISTASALSSLKTLDAFNRTESPLGSTTTQWSTMTLGGATVPNGNGTSPAQVTVSDAGYVQSYWYPDTATKTSAAYWNAASFSGSGSTGTAVGVTTTGSSCSVGRYFALWLDTPAPTAGKSGYEASFTCSSTSSGAYNVEINSWVTGTKTVVASTSSAQTLASGSKVALADVGGTLGVYVNSGSGFTQLISGTDSTFTTGYAGIMGSGTAIAQLTNFAAGTISTATGTSGTPWKLVRATGADSSADYQTSGDFAPGSLVTVSSGTQNASSIWQLQALSPAAGWTLDRDPQTFVIKAGPNSVGSNELKDSSVGNTELQAGAVGPGKIAAGAVQNGNIASQAVQSGNIANNAVGPTQLSATPGATFWLNLSPGQGVLDPYGQTVTLPTNAVEYNRNITYGGTYGSYVGVPIAGVYAVTASVVVDSWIDGGGNGCTSQNGSLYVSLQANTGTSIAWATGPAVGNTGTHVNLSGYAYLPAGAVVTGYVWNNQGCGGGAIITGALLSVQWVSN